MTLRRRKTDLAKPAHLTNAEWLASLQSERAEILRQIRREVHSRGNGHQGYFDRLERAIAFTAAEVTT